MKYLGILIVLLMGFSMLVIAQHLGGELKAAEIAKSCIKEKTFVAANHAFRCQEIHL